ncbi:MAG TPA: hypothetical protein PKA64_18680, partial [Myxococcota bacterium]|nr:hypothetical protein [Myxococcota bacterium]
MTAVRAASLALLSACASSGPATFEIGVRMSRLGPDDLALDLVDLSLELAALRLRSCPDTPNERAYIRGFNASERPRVLLPAAGPVNLPIGGRLLATRDRGFDVIVGPWCEVDVVLDGPLCVVADAPDTGARLELALRLPDLTFPDVDRVGRVEEVQDAGSRKAEKVIAPATLELAAGPWLDAVLPDLLAGQDVRVEPPADGGDG